MAAQQATASEEDVSLCTRCVRTGKHAIKYCVECPAFMCDTCLSRHKGIVDYVGHKLLDSDSFPTERCADHFQQLITKFCGVHDALCCSTCVSRYHSQCDVVHLHKASKGVKHSEEYKSLMRDMDSVQKKIGNALDERKRDKIKNIKDEITCFRNKANTVLDDLEKAATEIVDKRYKQYEPRIQMDINALEQAISTIAAKRTSLYTYNGENESKLFVNLKQGEIKMNEGESLCIDISTNEAEEKIEFVFNDIIPYFLDHTESLGEFVTAVDESVQQTQIYSVGLLCEFKLEGVKQVIDACQTEKGNLLIATVADKMKVSRLNSAYQIQDSCYLSEKPTALCAIGPTEAAVALGCSFTDFHRIQMLAVGDHLVLTRVFYIGSPCRGLAYFNGNIFVTSGGKFFDQVVPSVNVFTKQGSYNGYALDGLARPKQITVGSGCASLYVADKKTGIVHVDIKSMKTSPLAPDLKDAKGLCMDKNNQLLVCDKSGQNIIQLDRNGNVLKDLLTKSDGIYNVQTLCYDTKNNRLVVFMDTNTIKCFDLK